MLRIHLVIINQASLKIIILINTKKIQKIHEYKGIKLAVDTN